jgi:hypothetical protein
LIGALSSCLSFSSLPPLPIRATTQRNSMRHTKEPTTQRTSTLYLLCSANQHHKSGLKSIINICGIAKQLPTGGQNGFAMSLHQLPKSLFVAVLAKVGQ